mmetsp:Transcript_3093/g.9431  ORF Transcript_3093/g.9431 Transcript_3093/m.9431 type:complete len:93 (-) Transcript_3093:3050-3328(-)
MTTSWRKRALLVISDNPALPWRMQLCADQSSPFAQCVTFSTSFSRAFGETPLHQAAVEQITCAMADEFVGTKHSTFLFLIERLRENLANAQV